MSFRSAYAFFDRIIKEQGMAFARPDKVLLEEAIRSVDVVHFLMPFALSIEGRKIAERLGVPHTAAFHVQPENITYTIGMGKMDRTEYCHIPRFPRPVLQSFPPHPLPEQFHRR